MLRLLQNPQEYAYLPLVITMMKVEMAVGGNGVYRKPGSWRAEDDGVQYEPLLAMPFEGKGDGFIGNLRDPPAPTPLLFLPMLVGDKLIRALLDSGASDSFISADVVRVLGVWRHPLVQPLTVRVANGDGCQ